MCDYLLAGVLGFAEILRIEIILQRAKTLDRQWTAVLFAAFRFLRLQSKLLLQLDHLPSLPQLYQSHCTSMESIFEIKWSNTKGYGVFAKRAIPKNTTIIEERPILTVKPGTSGPASEDINIEAAFRSLTPSDQQRFLQLHEGKHPNAKTRVTRIFHANAFGDEDTFYVYPTASRINHSCRPNASPQLSARIIRSEMDIAAGEEISISYLAPFAEGMTAGERSRVLELQYGFQCRCAACWPPEQRSLSDARRRLIGFFDSALQGYQPRDFSVPKKASMPQTSTNWPSQPTRRDKVLTSSQKIEYNFLLASLREAEGIVPYPLIVNCYLEAAKELILLQNRYEKDGANASTQVVFLQAARCIKAWWEKTLDLEREWNGADHEKIREGEAAFQQLSKSVSCLSMLENLVGLLHEGDTS